MGLLLGHSAQLPLGLHHGGHRPTVGLGLDGRIGGVTWPACQLVEQPLGHDDRGRRLRLDADGRQIALTTRRTALQARAVTAIGADTRNWDRADID